MLKVFFARSQFRYYDSVRGLLFPHAKVLATRLAPFLDRYDVDLIALMTEVNRSVGGRKRPGWSKLYAEWLIKEPRLKEWCSNPDVFRTTYHRLVKDGRVRLR